MLQDALNSLVAPVAVRQLDITEGVVERVDDLVDRLACVGLCGLQPHDPSVKLPCECPEVMYVKCVHGGSEDKGNDEQGCNTEVRNGRSHICNRYESRMEDIFSRGDTDDHGCWVPSLDSPSLLSYSALGSIRHVQYRLFKSLGNPHNGRSVALARSPPS